MLLEGRAGLISERAGLISVSIVVEDGEDDVGCDGGGGDGGGVEG